MAAGRRQAINSLPGKTVDGRVRVDAGLAAPLFFRLCSLRVAAQQEAVVPGNSGGRLLDSLDRKSDCAGAVGGFGQGGSLEAGLDVRSTPAQHCTPPKENPFAHQIRIA